MLLPMLKSLMQPGNAAEAFPLLAPEKYKNKILIFVNISNVYIPTNIYIFPAYSILCNVYILSNLVFEKNHQLRHQNKANHLN